MAYSPIQVASYYAHLFAARQDVYSKWVDGVGWRPVRGPLIPEVILAGLSRSGPSISGYMGATTHVVALDFDTDNGLDQAFQVARFVDAPAYVETSRRGAHLWMVLDRVVPAIAARAALRGLIQSAGLPDDPHIELRPGADTIKEDGLGFALRLPWMPHPKTGVIGDMYNAQHEVMGPTIAAALLDIEWADTDTFLAWGERWVRPPVTDIPRTLREPRDDYPDDTTKASDILREMWGVANATPGRNARCPAHDDKVASLSILKDDRRAICHAGGCLLNNGDRGRGTYELRQLAPR